MLVIVIKVFFSKVLNFLLSFDPCVTVVSLQEVSNKLKHSTDSKGSIAMMFATSNTCTVEELAQHQKEKCKMAKGWKIPQSFLQEETVNTIKRVFLFLF